MFRETCRPDTETESEYRALFRDLSKQKQNRRRRVILVSTTRVPSSLTSRNDATEGVDFRPFTRRQAEGSPDSPVEVEEGLVSYPQLPPFFFLLFFLRGHLSLTTTLKRRTGFRLSRRAFCASKLRSASIQDVLDLSSFPTCQSVPRTGIFLSLHRLFTRD